MEYNYSFDEIEKIADEQNLKYDPTRLTELKPLDAYDYGEKMLGLSFDWKYLTPTGSLDGVTFFNDCTCYVAPCRIYGELPSKEVLLKEYTPIKIFVKANTVIIDQSILDKPDEFNYKEKFTVTHECSHSLLHPKGFTMASCAEWEPYEYGSYKKMTISQKHEAQANHLAAAILMPREITTKVFYSIVNDKELDGISAADKLFTAIHIMAKMCEVTAESLIYRLNHLKITNIKINKG